MQTLLCLMTNEAENLGLFFASFYRKMVFSCFVSRQKRPNFFPTQVPEKTDNPPTPPDLRTLGQVCLKNFASIITFFTPQYSPGDERVVVVVDHELRVLLQIFGHAKQEVLDPPAAGGEQAAATLAVVEGAVQLPGYDLRGKEVILFKKIQTLKLTSLKK